LAGATFAFFPEGAYGPTNNCVGIADVLRSRGHRVVFIAEESFAGTLEAKGFEERLMRLTPPAEEAEEDPGQFWKDFIRDTAPVFAGRRSSSSRGSSRRPSRRCATGPASSTSAWSRSSASSSPT
jgi:hypothetical protein